MSLINGYTRLLYLRKKNPPYPYNYFSIYVSVSYQFIQANSFIRVLRVTNINLSNFCLRCISRKVATWILWNIAVHFQRWPSKSCQILVHINAHKITDLWRLGLQQVDCWHFEEIWLFGLSTKPKCFRRLIRQWFRHKVRSRRITFLK